MFEKNKLSLVIRVFSYSILATTFVFLINNVLTVWFEQNYEAKYDFWSQVN